jgi:hypothetical protein
MTATPLIMQKNPEASWIKKSPMMGLATGPRPPVQEDHRKTLRVSRLLNPKRLTIPDELMCPGGPYLFEK